MRIQHTCCVNLKSEKSIKEYLKTLPDDSVIKYYLDVEYSPFPVLLIEEYTRRFKRKTKNEIIKDLKYQTRLAHKKTQELGRLAKKHKFVDDVTKEKSEAIINHAKKKGYEFSELIVKKGNTLQTRIKKDAKSGIKKSIKTGRKLNNSTLKYLKLLENLEELKKAKIITNKEFQEKKKIILSKI